MNFTPGFADVYFSEGWDLAQPLGFGAFHLILKNFSPSLFVTFADEEDNLVMNDGCEFDDLLAGFEEVRPKTTESTFKDGRTSALDRCVAPNG